MIGHLGKHRTKEDPNKALMYPLLFSAMLLMGALYAFLILFLIATQAH